MTMSRKQPDLEDIHPRSHPEDRQEGSFNPDPNLEAWTGASAEAAEAGGGTPGPAQAIHSPGGEADDDDGAGNPSPRAEESPHGPEDADQGDLGAT